jgi:ABC-type lipoprotein export system ATPase subunit
VFLDEPTASVDEKTRNDIARIIVKEKQSAPNVTFVVISHDAAFVNSLNCTMRIKLKNNEPGIAESI